RVWRKSTVSPSWLNAVSRPRSGTLRGLMRRDSNEILFTPYRVEFTQLRGGQPPEHLIIECDNEAGGTWQPALAALIAGLKQLAWSDADVRVRLSNHFVRYALVPTLTRLRNREER